MSKFDHIGVKINRRSALLVASGLAGLNSLEKNFGSALAQSNGESAVWTLVPVSDQWPAARWDHTLAALESSRSLLLFGGRNSDGAPLGDSWRFDVKTKQWAVVEGEGPAPRFGQAIASVPKTDSFYLFGGQAGDIFYNDLWRFDDGTAKWKLLDDGSGLSPFPRYGTSLVLGPANQLIVSHGFTFEGRFSDSWLFDLAGQVWEDITPASLVPERRCLHEAVWYSVTDQMVLFGGCSSGYGPCPQGDFWALDPVNREWTQILLDPVPTARSNPALIADPGRDRLILFGGLTEAGYNAELWYFANSAWTQASQSAEGPLPRSSHDLALVNDRAWLFGGAGDQKTYNDLWYLVLD